VNFVVISLVYNPSNTPLKKRSAGKYNTSLCSLKAALQDELHGGLRANGVGQGLDIGPTMGGVAIGATLIEAMEEGLPDELPDELAGLMGAIAEGEGWGIEAAPEGAIHVKSAPATRADSPGRARASNTSMELRPGKSAEGVNGVNKGSGRKIFEGTHEEDEPESDMPDLGDVPAEMLIQYFKDLFSAADINEDGSLQSEEFRRLMESSGFHFAPADIEELARKADVNFDGLIDYGEFETVALQMHKAACTAAVASDEGPEVEEAGPAARDGAMEAGLGGLGMPTELPDELAGLQAVLGI
jgi:hypothetical protein